MKGDPADEMTVITTAEAYGQLVRDFIATKWGSAWAVDSMVNINFQSSPRTDCQKFVVSIEARAPLAEAKTID